MGIKTVTKYQYKGVEYDSLKAVQDAVHNTIGEEVLDKLQRVCQLTRHADWFKVLDVLCKPEVRQTLIECYNVTYIETSPIVDSSDVYQGEKETELNILDLK